MERNEHNIPDIIVKKALLHKALPFDHVASQTVLSLLKASFHIL